MIHADEEVHPDEESFLQRLLEHFELPADSDIEPLADREQSLETLAALSASERQEALALVIGAAAVDGEVAEAERKLIDALADELGVDKKVLDQRLERVLGR
jgi:uncharacterized tellurite resistance protein B-like protein